jgi:hypothetical protein
MKYPREIVEKYEVRMEEENIMDIEPLKSLLYSFEHDERVERNGAEYAVVEFSPEALPPYYVFTVRFWIWWHE